MSKPIMMKPVDSVAKRVTMPAGRKVSDKSLISKKAIRRAEKAMARSIFFRNNR